MEGIQQVKAALGCLYGKGYSKEAFKQADSWLQEFQHSEAAWEVSDALLSEDGVSVETLFFAAETLYAKIKYDFRELQPPQIESLKIKIVGHLARWGQQSGALRPFLKKLCVAVAALSVQINWQSVLTELVNLMSANNVPTDLVLELMEVLPEECHSDRVAVDDGIRASFRTQLLNDMPHVLSYLCNMDTTGDGKASLQNRIFLCMERWIHHFREFPASRLLGNKVINDAFSVTGTGSQAGQVYESAVLLLVEVLHRYPCKPENMDLVLGMVPPVMHLKPAYEEATRTEDVESARGCCQIFTEMATSYMELLMSPEQLQQEQLVALVLQCTAHPDSAINTLTLDFWTHLITAMDRLPNDRRDMKIAQFNACLSQLILVCAQNMRWPDDVESMERDQQEDIADHRYKLGDTLKEVCHCLGPVHCLSQIAVKLQADMVPLLHNPSSPHCWRDVEAGLWAIRSISQLVPDDEATVVPQLMAMVPQLPPQHPRLRQTVNHVIGHFARWLRGHQDMLRSLYDYLLNGMGIPETASSSAIALRDVLMACGHLMGEPALNLYDALIQASYSGTIKFKDEVKVLEGLSSVVSTLPYESAKNFERNMVTPVANHLMGLVQRQQQLSGGVERAISNQVADDLDRLTVILRYCEPRRRDGAASGREGNPISPSVEMMQLLWPVFEAVRETFKTDGDVLEKLCRVFKHALRAGKEHFAPLLTNLITFFLTSFKETSVSSFLYACAICVSEFGGRSDHAYEAPLLKMLEEASHMSMGVLSQPQGFENHPDVSEEFFYLVARFLTIRPQPLFQNHRSLLMSVLNCAVASMGVQHRLAQKAVLHLLEMLVKTGLDEKLGLRQPVTEVVVVKGQEIVQKVVYGLAGEMDPDLVDDSGGSMAGLLWKLYNLCPNELRNWLIAVLWQSNALDQVALDPDKNLLLNKLSSPSAEKEDFIYVVRKFGRRCRDNMKRWRKKAAAQGS